MPNNVFVKKKPVMQKEFAGLPSYVLKAVAATKIDGPEMDAIKEACKESNISFNCPGVVGETVLHFTFPRYKTGLLIRSDSSMSYKVKTAKCENMGWTVTTVSINTLRCLTRETIIAQFKEYIATFKTSRK